MTKLVRRVSILEEDLNNRSLDIAETELDIEQLLDKLPGMNTVGLSSCDRIL